ncbi:MAG: peptidoglycan-binding protein [Evtepia sp.]
MGTVIVPYIPTYITVHMARPEVNAENITVSFPDYIKNVASSEIYPTWGETALRANILAQISFALNRVYTEFYPSQGYDFNITASTSIDQKFIKGRNIFKNVEKLVDEMFDDYIRREGFAEPLSTQFCNGTTSTCDGLSQWGSEYLSQEGYSTIGILEKYYGENVEIVYNAPIRDIHYSYPGVPLRKGSVSKEVYILQRMLNRVSQSYPSISKIWPEDGIFGAQTETTVKAFQKVFNLTVDGVVGKVTWYRLIYMYTRILKLSELVSEGQTYFHLNFQYPDSIAMGDSGEKVLLLQYVLSILAEFNPAIPFVNIDGKFGVLTYNAVMALQGQESLPQTGVVGEETWDVMVREFAGISKTVLTDPNLFPVELAGFFSKEQLTNALTSQQKQHPGATMKLGQTDADRSVP